ncbi:MAG: type 4a pilus biogenesis protein PilO [Candidatus Lindowbacteria bacterium]|nr:type 4a pilus biogenesis protein PilO [Candidatus Lindowbacteria bacterium]
MEFFKDRVITKADWIIIGVSLFALLIVTLLYFLGLSYGKGQIKEVDTQIAAAQARVAEARAIAAKRDTLVRELAQVRQRISTFEEKLPTEKEVPKLLDQFQQIAELSGVKYRLITAEPIDEKESLYVRIPFKVKVDGAYPEIGVFLRSLEFGNRFIKVENVDIGPEKGGRSEANFVISTFMFVTREEASESGVTKS